MQIAERPTHETPKFYGWQVSASKEGEFEQPKVTFQGLKFPKSAIWIFVLKMTPLPLALFQKFIWFGSLTLP